MKYYKQVQLHNGKLCVLRNPDSNDAQEILNHMIITSNETENLLRYGDEITMTLEEEATYLSAVESSSDSIMISAVIDGRIIANAGLNPISKLEKCKHRAELGISIQREYWGKGIGSHLMGAIFEVAREVGYKQIELDVVTENKRAIALYNKFGFQIFGTNETAFLCRDGKYQALYLMSYKL